MDDWLRVGIVSLALAATTSAPASADISVAGGGYLSSTATLGGAILLSSAASVPSLPIELQATALLPINNQGGYALTGEVRGLSGGGFGGAYVGAGAGIGNLSAGKTGGLVLTVFVGKPLAPLTTFEARLYKGIQAGGATSGFVGVRFSI